MGENCISNVYVAVNRTWCVGHFIPRSRCLIGIVTGPVGLYRPWVPEIPIGASRGDMLGLWVSDPRDGGDGVSRSGHLANARGIHGL